MKEVMIFFFSAMIYFIPQPIPASTYRHVRSEQLAEHWILPRDLSVRAKYDFATICSEFPLHIKG